MTLVLVGTTITVVLIGIMLLVGCSVYSKLSNRVDSLATSTSSLADSVSSGFTTVKNITEHMEVLKTDVENVTHKLTNYDSKLSNMLYEVQWANDKMSGSIKSIQTSADSIKRGIDEKTYTLLCDLKEAVDSSDVTKLAGVVHAATMLMRAYEKANGLCPFQTVEYSGFKCGMDLSFDNSSNINERIATPKPVKSSDGTPYAI